MNKFDNIKKKFCEVFESDKARITGACVCALVLCLGIGFGVSGAYAGGAESLSAKAGITAVSGSSATQKTSENAENKEDVNSGEDNSGENRESADKINN